MTTPTPTYLIYPTDATGRMPVFEYASRAAAQAAATPNAYLVEHEADCLWTGRGLVDVYNAITGLHVAKFESSDVGRRRLVTQLARYATKAAPTEAQVIDHNQAIDAQKEPTVNDTAKLETETVVTNAADATPVTKTGRAKKFSGGDVVTFVGKNYKRAGSEAFDRFARYRVGMTVDEAIAAGLKWVDLLWDTKEGNDHVKIAPAGSPEAIAARSAE